MTPHRAWNQQVFPSRNSTTSAPGQAPLAGPRKCATTAKKGSHSVIDHIMMNVKDYGKSKTFYEQALAAVGYECISSSDENLEAGFKDADGRPSLWVNQREPFSRGLHFAIHVADNSLVDAFHAAAIEAGGSDNGAPGIRENYHPSYYAAYVLDPDGNNIEAVHHEAAGW